MRSLRSPCSWGKENATETSVYDVTGSLCENNDKFAIDRPLPRLEPGDLLADAEIPQEQTTLPGRIATIFKTFWMKVLGIFRH